jgi:hypothetical protein
LGKEVGKPMRVGYIEQGNYAVYLRNNSRIQVAYEVCRVHWGSLFSGFLKIFSTLVSPRQPKARSATDWTNVSDGSVWLKLFEYIVQHRKPLHTTPTKRFEDA